jgi:hypothetical protein
MCRSRMRGAGRGKGFNDVCGGRVIGSSQTRHTLKIFSPLTTHTQTRTQTERERERERERTA